MSPTTSTMLAPKCALCNKAPCGSSQFQKCAGCKAAFYCSKACQKRNWKTHKLVCDQFKPFEATNPRPSAGHKLGLLFSIDAVKPQFVWVPCNQSTVDQHWEKPDLKQYLGDDGPIAEMFNASLFLAKRNTGLQRHNIDHTVSLHVRERFASDGSTRNQCVAEMMMGKLRHDWKGDIVLLSQAGTLKNPPSYQDIVPSDLRVAADFFRVYGSGLDHRGPPIMIGPVPTQDPFSNTNPESVQGVLIASKGDVVMDGKVKFAQVSVTMNHPMFNFAKPTQISVHMGMPLLVRKISNFSRADLERGDKHYINPFQNRTALFLNMEADHRGESWGYADIIEWDQTIGSVLVVRQDKKALTAQHVEAITKFCRFELARRWEAYRKISMTRTPRTSITRNVGRLKNSLSRST